MKFVQALILGTGRLPLDCALALREKNMPVAIYDCDQAPSGILKRQAKSKEIAYYHLPKKELFDTLSKVETPSLVVSAINPYILPKSVLENGMLTAINCHQALLPRHPGRNAEMWAIYEGDASTGITWHLLTADVDAGDILIQKSFPIEESMNSYQVFRRQIQLAGEAFKEILKDLLNGVLSPTKQELSGERTLHYSYEMPNGAILDPDWPQEKVSAFLRACDYGILNVVERPKLLLNGASFVWKTYKLTKEHPLPDGIHFTGDSILIQKPGLLVTLKNYHKEEQ